MLYERKLEVIDANILYFIGAILFFTIGFYFQNLNLELGLIITQYILILLPPIVYLNIKKISVKKTMRLNKLGKKNGLLIVFITLLMYPTAVVANTLFMVLLSLLGNLNIPELPSASSPSQYILLMLIISMSAGICEEFFFRGFILSAYETLGKKKAIIISSVLFGIFHFNLYNLFGPIVLGLVFSYLVILTDSLYAGIIGHIVNNGFAVTLAYIMNISSKFLVENQEVVVESTTTQVLLISSIFFAGFAIITVAIAFKLINIIKKDMNKKNDTLNPNNFYLEGLKYEKEIVESMSFKNYIPLLLVLPFYFVIAYIQIKEIMSLG